MRVDTKLDRLFGVFDDYFFGPTFGWKVGEEYIFRSLAYTKEETEEGIKLEFVLPGVKKDAVDLQVKEDVLYIYWTSRGKKISQTVTGLGAFDLEKVDARLEDGILYISIPRVSGGAKKIEVK